MAKPRVIREEWRVLIKMELELLRTVAKLGSADGEVTQVVTKQDTIWGAIDDSPKTAFEKACDEGFTTYTEGLPEGERVVGVN